MVVANARHPMTSGDITMICWNPKLIKKPVEVKREEITHSRSLFQKETELDKNTLRGFFLRSSSCLSGSASKSKKIKWDTQDQRWPGIWWLCITVSGGSEVSAFYYLWLQREWNLKDLLLAVPPLLTVNVCWRAQTENVRRSCVKHLLTLVYSFLLKTVHFSIF
jgi:hypothetical protein